jgi:hypothetical protein
VTTIFRFYLSIKKHAPWYPIKKDVGWRYKYNTGMFLGLIVKCTVSGADTNLMLPSDPPISQNPSTTLLVAVINSSLCDVKIYSSECALIRELLS